MKACIQLWKQIYVHNNGRVWFCCMKPSRTQKIDPEHCDPGKAGEILNCDEVYRLRREMIAEKLPGFCKGCMMLREYETVSDFVGELFKEGCIPRITDDAEEICRIDHADELFFEITTRCNLKCIYCLHSTSAFKDWIADMGVEKFFDLLDVLTKAWRVREISTTGIGEFTLVAGWTRIIRRIKATYPGLRISLFSNFAKALSDEEIDTLAEADKIYVSCDTVDAELFRFLRSGDLKILLDNLTRLNACRERKHSGLRIVIAAVVNSKNLDSLEGLLEYIIETGCADELNLTPMTLPMPAAKMLDVYPVSVFFQTEKEILIAELLKELRDRGQKEGIDVNWSGDLQNFYA